MKIKENLRILQVHNYYQIPGGEDIVVSNEKKLLEENGYEVFTYYRNNDELRAYTGGRKLLLPFMAVFSIKTYREVKQLIRQNQIDIVHVHNTLTVVSPSVFYAAFACKVPVVQTLHNFRMLCPAGSFLRSTKDDETVAECSICEECAYQGLGRAIHYGCYRNSKAQTFVSASILKIHRMLGTYRRVNFICLSEFNRKKILLLNQKRKVVDENRIFIKPNFAFCDTKGHNMSTKQDYYLFVGRMEALKGIDIVIKAFEKLPNQRLVIAGDGPMRNEMELYVQTHKMTNVTFLGFVDREKLRQSYQNARALIQCSQCYEAFPMAITEAYAAGTPVIAGDIGNVGALVQEDYTGIHFTYDHPEALAQAVLKFEAKTQSEVEEMARNARAYYSEHLTPQMNVKNLMAIYQTCMQTK